jgi:hypothetical protein
VQRIDLLMDPPGCPLQRAVTRARQQRQTDPERLDFLQVEIERRQIITPAHDVADACFPSIGVFITCNAAISR